MSTGVDPRTLSLDELRAAIEQGVPPAPDPDPTPDQPRDDKGRFVSPDPDPATIDPDPADPVDPDSEGLEVPEMFVREIDLGDGSGVQVFKAPTLEELVDKLADAQANATKKIRELSQRPDPKPAAPPDPTPDEEAALSQRLLANPTAVIKEIEERAARKAQEEIRAQQEASRQAAQTAQEAAIAFVKATPDYYPCPENQERIGRYMDLYKIPATPEGIQQAYEATKEFLKAKPAATTPARSSNLSTRRGSPPPTQTPADFRTSAMKMSREELLEKAGGYQNSY